MFNEWIKQLGVDRCYLVEAKYLLAGVEHTLYLSTHPYRSQAGDSPAYTPYSDYITDLGEFDRQMSELFTGFSTLGAADIELYLHPTDIEPLLEQADFGGQPVTILCGDPAWPRTDFGVIATGLGDSLTANNSNTATLKLRDRAEVFDTPVLTATFEDGPSKGRVKPLVLGTCFNVTPELIDANAHQYYVGGAVSVVREDGQSIPFTDNGDGSFTLTNAAQGDVTCDAAAPANLQTAMQIFNHLLGLLGLPAIASGSWPDYGLGLYLSEDDNLTYADAFDAIAASVGGAWYYNRYAALQLYRYTPPPALADQVLTASVLNPTVSVWGPVAEWGHQGSTEVTVTRPPAVDLSAQIVEDSLRPVRRIPPIRTLRLGYARNWSPARQLAGVIHETQPELAKRLQDEHLYVEGSNTSVSSDAQDITTDTLLVNEADALAEQSRRLANAQVSKNLYELTAISAPFSMNLGDIVAIEYPQYFKGGKNAVITRLNDQLTDDLVRMEVLR